MLNEIKQRVRIVALASIAGLAALAVMNAAALQDAPTGEAPLDPAAWGADHVGKRLPEYVTGGECLFCHRDDVGSTWDRNDHARTIRFLGADEKLREALGGIDAIESVASETEFVVGRANAVRFLKRGQGYGKLDISSVHFKPGAEGESGAALHADDPKWSETKFAESCAGCHATAVDGESMAYSAFSLDCYSCHGDVTLDHTSDTKQMLLAKDRDDPGHIVASICGQCHLRGGASRSTGLPYPNQFIAGDNLFRDFAADFSDEFIEGLNPGDRHVYRNVRDMAVEGRSRVTCLTCHEVHKNSSELHTGVRKSAICYDCHNREGPIEGSIAYEVHSETCEY